jgi:uncharacterized protein YuzE
MTILYTKDANMLSIHLGGEVAETVQFEEGLYLDLDSNGQVIGIETHDAKGFLEKAASTDGVELPNLLKPSSLVGH